MNKKRISLALIIGLLLSMLSGMGAVSEEVPMTYPELLASLNGVLRTNSERVHSDVFIESPPEYVQLDVEQALDFLTTGSGVLYFAFPECPWCRSMVEGIADAMRTAEAPTLFVCNALAEREIRTADEKGIITVTQEASETFQKIMDLLYDWLPQYAGIPDAAIHRLYFPTMAFVENGVVLDVRSGTLEGHDDVYTPMTDEMYAQMVTELVEQITKITPEGLAYTL